MEVDGSRLAHLVQSFENACNDKRLVAEVLEKSGLPGTRAVSATETVWYESEVRFAREACTALGDVTFAARAGLTFQTTSSLNSFIGKYSRDLREAIENTSKFYDLLDPSIAYSLRCSGNSASVDFAWKDRSYAKYHRHTEFILFGAISRIRTLTETNVFPFELRLDHEVSQSRVAFQKLAGFPIVFGAEAPEIILSPAALSLPIPTFNQRLREHLTEYGHRLLQEQKRGEYTLRSRVESLLMAALPGKMLTIEDVAAALGLSPRTFARRLKDDALSYREIADDLRKDLAVTFIKDAMPLSEIAHALGFADQAAFSTAFKRWTGMPPSQFR